MKKKICAVLLAVMMTLALGLPHMAFAESFASTLSASSTSVLPGKKFTVTVGFSCSEELFTASVNLGYSSDVFESVECTPSAHVDAKVDSKGIPQQNPFYIGYTTGPATKKYSMATVTFKVKSGVAAGTKVTISTTGGIGTKDSDVTKVKLTNASVSITVAAPAPPPASSKTPTVPPKPSTPTLSNNAKLKSLSIDGVTMSFSPTTHEYGNFTVPADTESLTVHAEAAEKDAKVAITGHTSLRTGQNWIVVKVTAPDGKSIKKYNIGIVRASAAASTATPSSAPVSQETPSAPESDTVASVPPSSAESDLSSTAPDVSSKPDSSAPDSSDDPSSEATSSAEPERPNAFLAWLRADHSRWAIHAAYIGGMIVCLLAGCALGYFIRGRRDSE